MGHPTVHELGTKENESLSTLLSCVSYKDVESRAWWDHSFLSPFGDGNYFVQKVVSTSKAFKTIIYNEYMISWRCISCITHALGCPLFTWGSTSLLRALAFSFDDEPSYVK